jgi:dTDP-glucose pyrophosphorylase
MSSLIITMAGESSRFRQAGYTQPKYRLKVNDRSLFSWSIESVRNFVDAGWQLCFIGRAMDLSLREFIEDELRQFGSPRFELVSLDKPTDGQATTAVKARPYVADDEACAIYNIDTYVDPTVLLSESFNGDGWIPCFPGEGDSWSFAVSDDANLVSEVREKIRVSTHCTVGFYGFRTFKLFTEAYEKGTQASGAAETKERYIAPLYNVLIDEGLEVRNHCLPGDSVIPLGTPTEVSTFAERHGAKTYP